MIIVEKAAEAIDEVRANDDPPPSYHTPSSSRGSAANTNPQQQSTALPRPTVVTNFIALSRRDHSIKERYAIDPCISVPSSLLPPLEEGETEADRKNLKLKTNDGSIDVDIWVLGDGDGEFKTAEGVMKPKRATLDICSNDGSITVRIHSVAEMPKRNPFHLNVHAKDGHVQIHVPRSFHGPMGITVKDGSVQFSDQLSPLVTTLSEVKRKRRCFVGALPQSDGAWTGDEVEIYAKDGHVDILYEDEIKTRGFFRRIFGF